MSDKAISGSAFGKTDLWGRVIQFLESLTASSLLDLVYRAGDLNFRLLSKGA